MMKILRIKLNCLDDNIIKDNKNNGDYYWELLSVDFQQEPQDTT